MSTLTSSRLPICQSCEHYLPPPDHLCKHVATLSSLPGKLGKLDHPLGIDNPCSQCPLKKWLFIPNDQIAFLLSHYPLLPMDEMKRLNKFNIGTMNTFSLAIRYYTGILQSSTSTYKVKLSHVKNIFDKAGALPYKWTPPVS